MTDSEYELVSALKRLLIAYDSLMPGVRYISVPDYQILNEAPIEARKAIERVETQGSTASSMSGQFYILVKPWAVYVKEASFFVSQGGTREPWGKDWELIDAKNIEDARRVGEAQRRNQGL